MKSIANARVKADVPLSKGHRGKMEQEKVQTLRLGDKLERRGRRLRER